MKFKDIFLFEQHLSKFTGAPYVITTCCCTHALELCFKILKPSSVKFTSYTYMGILMLLKNLKIPFNIFPEKWLGMYKFHNTNVWDSARQFTPNMYIPGSYICLSFGEGKPLDLGRGGAILLDNEEHYKTLNLLRFDGRDVTFDPWINQRIFDYGFHYKLNNRECIQGIEKLQQYISDNNFKIENINYTDCRQMIIKDWPSLK